MQLIDGRLVALNIRKQLYEQVLALTSEGKRAPSLAIVLVGNNPASLTYVRSKIRAAAEVGILARQIALPDTTTEQELISLIRQLNNDPSIDGFIVQLPLPSHINEANVLQTIDYRKDLDGLHPMNVGLTAMGQPALVSATPKGIRELLAYYQIHTQGKHVVIIGRSNIVGKPMAMLLMQKPYLSLPKVSANTLGDATVTLCHSKTQNLKQLCLSADIIIVAAGQPNLLTADMVPEGAVVIDVGINRIDDESDMRGYRLVGDVDFPNVAPRCSFITPVPGGVGPMTIASLLQNTLQAYNNHIHN